MRSLPSSLLILLVFCLVAPLHAEMAAWPEITQTALPWTRWWWHGSAADNKNLTRCLEQYADAGLGGVEITCIYGVKGTRDRQLRYLSPKWLDAVKFAAEEAKRLGMGVDLPPGSGWRMGGPSVKPADSNAVFVLAKPQAIVAYSPDGQKVDLTGALAEFGEKLNLPEDWEAWTILALSEQSNREQVKRPAPGGKGLNINPFNRDSVTHFLKDFGKRTADLPKGAIRASFHDSFEYEGNWSKNFLAKFAEERGYRLEEHLRELAGEGDRDAIARVKCDYRETMSDLVHDELIVPWVEWVHAQGQLARNQAHGSPGNWLDLYGVCDIPETESFGALRSKDANPLVQKFASSAAHVMGRKLVASESATWLEQHFTETLALVKERLDRQMLAGINHILYHGTAYSPDDAAWPGWLFYASTQLNPQNPIWRDFPALNEYVARCQAMLQAGEPANDLLIYWPIYDIWHSRRGLRTELRVHNADRWFLNQPIAEIAKMSQELGFGSDYISDAQILKCEVVANQIKTPGATYQAIVVPDAEYMPPATLAKLGELTRAGAKVVFWKRLPETAPGLLIGTKVKAYEAALGSVKEAAIVTDSLMAVAMEADINPEPFCAVTPLRLIRRKLPDGRSYFLKNTSDKEFDHTIVLNARWKDVVLMDPLSGEIGSPAVDGERLRVQLPAGGTIFVRTYDHEVEAEPWQYLDVDGDPIPVTGNWSVKFVAGGPELPEPFTTAALDTWTKLAGEAGEKFAGTATYSISLSNGAGRYLLSLGEVKDSARVFLNGEELGVLFAPPFQIPVEMVASENQLTVEVTNVAINRIRDLDRRKVKWQIFDDINIVGIDFEDGNKYILLNTAEWPVREAGLLGPVSLQRLAD